MSKIYVDEIAGIADADTVAIPGHVIQVVQATTTTPSSNTTDSYVDSGLSATITPTSASSKILVVASQKFTVDRDNTGMNGGLRIVRDSTAILSNGTYCPYVLAGGASTVQLHILYPLQILDSPNTTSAVTYKTQGRANDTTNNGVVRFQWGNDPSVITLMEIAG